MSNTSEMIRSHFRKTKAAIEWRPGNSFYNMVDELSLLYVIKSYFASTFLLDKKALTRSTQLHKPYNTLNNRHETLKSEQKAPVYLLELFADWALPIHRYELTQYQSNKQLNLQTL